MKKRNKITWTMWLALLLYGAVFVLPVHAQEREGEYLGTLEAGESISTRGLAYAVYQISATNIPAYGGWCTNCSTAGCHTYAKGDAVSSTYTVTVDGISVLDQRSSSASSGTIDLSAYSDKDAVLSLPKNHTVTQTIRCVGGNMANSTDPVSPCGYSSQRTITVTGSLQLYGYSKVPEVVSNPTGVQAGTDQSAVFTAAGNKVVACRWQKVTAAGITDLRDETDEDGVSYSGAASLQLTVRNLRTRLSGSSFRCILIGERGDEVPTEAALLTVSDITGPKVQLSYMPKDQTEGGVTIRITAVDRDSGLAPNPYYYTGGEHDQNAFTVKQNGTYEVKVRDMAGNSTSASVSISNIRPPAEKTVTPVVTPVPTANPTPTVATPTMTPGIITTPTPSPTSVVTPKPVNPGTPKNEDKDQEKKNETKQVQTPKNINIRNLTAGAMNSSTMSDLQEEEETVEEEILLSENPPEEVVPESLNEENDPVGTILAICFGVLLLLALLFLALLFPVRVENADELGNWHFCALKLLRRRHKNWELQVGLLLEDFDSLRLKFGMLFLAIIGSGTLTVITSEGETITVTEITQDLVLQYHQIGRQS
ncbi:MAG: hypothetical protein K6E16_02410 [Lachnospiraceae bacterium]|nr:hypothetical protein [Lachnospiraceae bacterium]